MCHGWRFGVCCVRHINISLLEYLCHIHLNLVEYFKKNSTLHTTLLLAKTTWYLTAYMNCTLGTCTKVAVLEAPCSSHNESYNNSEKYNSG